MDTDTAITVLGLPHHFDGPSGLASAWRRFARANHPDLHPHDPWAAMRFRVGREAYAVLLADLPEAVASPAPPRARGPFEPGEVVAVREWRA